MSNSSAGSSVKIDAEKPQHATEDAFNNHHSGDAQTAVAQLVDPNNHTRHSFLGLRGQRLQHMVSFMAGMGFLLFGYDQGVMGSLLTLPTFNDTFLAINLKIHPNHDTLQGFVVAVYEIGCLVGALFTMWLGDKIGRRKTIFVGCIIMIIGAIIQCASFSTGQLIVARIITGIGNGMNTSTVPVWQSECARPEKRGRLVMLQGALITGGIMISYWIDFGFYFIKHSSVSWRFPLAFQIIFPLFILPFILKLPESPRWLLKAGKIGEAVKVFSALEDVPANDGFIVTEVEEVEESLAAERAAGNKQSAIKKMFTQGEHRNFHRAMLAIWSQIMQQITGINLITYYAGTIFEKYIHMSPLNSRILAACNGTEYFLASWIAFYTIEKIGRRKLMLFGAVGQSLSMAVLTATTYTADPTHQNDSGSAIAAAVFLFIFNTFFAIGWLGMTWLYPAEITPLNIRAAANGFSTAGNWSFNFMVVMITPVAFKSIGSYTYTIFAVINALMLPVIFFLYPETSGRSLEEMDRIFALSNPWTPWDVVKIAKDLPYEYDHKTLEDRNKATATHVDNNKDEKLINYNSA